MVRVWSGRLNSGGDDTGGYKGAGSWAGTMQAAGLHSEGCLDHGGHGKIGSTPKRDGKAKTGTLPACCIDIKLAHGMVA